MKHVLLVLALIISSTTFAQDFDDNWEELSEKLPGYVITNKGEKIEGYLKRFLKIKSQRKVKFFKTLDDKPVVYDAKDLKAYQIADDYYESHPYEGLSGKTKVFLLRVLEGKIDLFEYYIRVEDDQGKEITIKDDGTKEIILDFDGTKIQTETLAVKDGDDYLKFASPKLLFSFKNVMSKYVSDYPELAKKIKNKEKGYKVLGILNIINEYNAHFENE
ncbi:hypothetical protein [Olleya aquimaris]|uniref:Uncharacterized protein n=1 Tax=Olleya aquimaris TaxID=639310 RepID=A0A327RBH1_9FLAO|nr:hypothetical protein [Olleya aquimaris]RAJ13518.1 hypothetical protein LY08_02038 [Olleya aquimaris]